MLFRIVVVMLAIVSFSACKTNQKPLCDAALVAAEQAAGGIAAILECENVFTIKDAISVPIQQSKICQQTEQPENALDGVGSVTSEIVCPLVAKFVSNVSAKQVPESWNCKAEIAKDKLKDAIEKGCRLAMNKK